MNMKKMKKFFTLSRRAEGFTLVELIVVIAILAILGGVAVPAYGGYVKKANMTADQQLASEVAHALSLYYYSNPGTAASGYVVLSTNGANGDGEVGNAAMAAVFGENWQDAATLKYDGWSSNGVLDGMLNDPSVATAVTNSSYMKGSTPEQLLDNAAQVTGSALNFLTKKAPNMNPEIYYSGIQGAFGQSEEDFNAMCEEYGIEVKQDANGNSVFGDDVTPTQLSNLMVVAAANDLSNGNESTASLLVLQYAGFAGAVNSPYATEDTKAAYETLNSTLNSASSMAEIQAAMDTFATDAGYLAYSEGEDTSVAEGDGAAFMSIMDALDASTSSLSDKAGLVANGNAFSSGEVVGTFNSYVTAAAAVSSMDPATVRMLQAAIASGDVVIFLAVTGNGCAVGASPAVLLPQ